ncbi:hypothetical protein ACNSOL_01480 [Aliarcobacter lanthieri]|uniref:hypothetical protein n=1 Tax=Aliarcobacter lanthieri TaxID=1355374 RepID=UPI003AAF415C
MKREELKKILSKHYSKDSVKSILCGRMKPPIKKRIVLNNEFDIPILAWENIKSYLGENISKLKDEKQLQEEKIK